MGYPVNLLMEDHLYGWRWALIGTADKHNWMFLFQRWLVGQVVTREKIEEAKAFSDAHLGPGLFNYAGET